MADSQDGTKVLPTPLHALQDASIKAARDMLEDSETAPTVKKELIESIWDRTGLQAGPSGSSQSQTVPLEVFGTALQALASQMGVQTEGPIELKGVTVEEIPTKTAKKTRKRLTRARQAVFEAVSEPDPEGA